MWMQLEIIVLSEVRKRKTSTMSYHLRVESKIWHKWTYHVILSYAKIDPTDTSSLLSHV